MPKEILFVAPYNFEALDTAPKVRAFNLINSLKKYANLTVLSGHFYERVTQEFKILNKDFDCVYIEALASKMYIADYCFFNLLKKKNLKIFPFIRDLYFQYPGTLKKNLPNNLFNCYCKREFDLYLKNATALLFPSQKMAESVNFPAKYVLPPAGDSSRCIDCELPNNKKVLYVGGISPKMGIGLLVEAMRIVVKKYPEAHCIIVGHGDKDIINTYKNEKFLSFINANYSQLDPILTQTYLTVIPLPIIPHNNFAIPVKLYNYLTFGRPIVATECTSMAEYINSNEVGLTTKDNPEDFANGILKMIDNREFAEKCGKNAISVIKSKDSWDHRATELLKIIDFYVSQS